MWRKLAHYLNPVSRLGKRKYSFLFPLIFSIAVCLLSELFAYQIMQRPAIVGRYILLINIASLIYFSFRDGVRAGIIASVIPIFYYFYIIYTREYTGARLSAGITTTLILGAIYVFLASIIGWLKQTIDGLIEREADEKMRLRIIIQQLPVGVIITDNQGRVMQTNEQLEAILGVKIPVGFSAQEALLRSDKTAEKEGALYALLGEMLTTSRNSVVGKELVFNQKNGKRVHIQVNSAPVSNQSGKVIAGTSIITDITEQKELERRKDDFINMASHELRTPLTSATIYMKLLKAYLEKNEDQKGLSLQGKINKQFTSLTELVHQLLDITNIERGSISIQKKTFFVKELAAEIVESLQGFSKHKLVLDWHTKEYVLGDKERIRQVLVNLVSNAIKYSPENSTVVISSKKEGETLVIGVSDQGIGIPKSELTKVFDRFYQVDEEQAKTHPGLGFGLYISKKIIEMHNGKIWAQSEVGKGSTFYFSLSIYKGK